MDQLATFTAEVESSLNSRPITFTSDERDAFLPLRPIDFLAPKAQIKFEVNEGDVEIIKGMQSHDRLAAVFRATTEALEAFWSRWHCEYLLILRERSKWSHRCPRLQNHSEPRENDVVLIEEEFSHRNLWPIARIVELNGQPGAIRSVKLKLPSGRIVTRPINRICPLETANPMEQEKPTQKVTTICEDAPEVVEESRTKVGDTKTQKTSHHMTTRRKAKGAANSLFSILFVVALTSSCHSHPLQPQQNWIGYIARGSA
jgi:hypothetical protein